MKAFPTLTEHERRELDKRGIDIERSFRDWLEQLTGRDAAGVDELIRVAAADVLPLIGVGPVSPLTDAEKTVLCLLAMGCSERTAAERLGVSRGSVSRLVKRARARTGARTGTQAVVIALICGELT